MNRLLSRVAVSGVSVAVMLFDATVAGAAVQDARPRAPSALSIQATRAVSFETTEGTLMNVDLSPDGRTIMFDLLGDIYTVPIRGGTATQLTRGLGYDLFPVWSPDGRQIAFASDRSGHDNFWVMNADGTHARPVTRGSEPVYGRIEWAPDGKSLVGWQMYDLAGGKRPLPSVMSGGRFYRDGEYVYSRTRTGVWSYHRATGAITKLAQPPIPMIAAVVSPDGRWLAYITGDRQHEVDARDIGPYNGLRLRNLATGEDRWLAYPVDKRRISFERFVFTHDSKAVLIGFGGKLHRLDVATGEDTIIPFTARVHVELGPFAHQHFRVTNDSVTVHQIRSPAVSPDGKTLVFSALQRLYTMALPNGTPQPLVMQPYGQFQPAYSPDGQWIAYVTWSDDEVGHVWRVPAAGGTPERLTRVAGHYRRPTWSPDGATLAVLNSADLSFNSLSHGGQLQLLPSTGGVLRTIAEDVSREVMPTFAADGQHLLLQGGNWELIAVGRDGNDRRVRMRVRVSTRGPSPGPIAASPDGRYVAYFINRVLYLARLSDWEGLTEIDHSTPSVPAVRLMRHGALDLRWERGGRMLTWVYANQVYRIDPDAVMAAAAADTIVRDNTAWEPALVPHRMIPVHLTAPRHVARGTVALRGARVITMRGDEVLDDATVVITDDRITAVGPSATTAIPAGAAVRDVRGKTIMPGLVDLHAHLNPPPDAFGQRHWPYEVNLAYGVTTARDPSSSDDPFGYAELVETGQVLGPRVFTVGKAISEASVNVDDLADARALVQYHKAMGAVLVKQYSLPTRRQRQWILLAAQEAGLNVTCEEGDAQGMVRLALDGFPGVEHSPGQVSLYGDVTRLLAEAKTWYTPTLQAAYGGQGDVYFGARYRMLDDPKYRRLVPSQRFSFNMRRGELRHPGNFKYMNFVDAARPAAAILQQGGHVTLGSHGNDQGVGAHWELWALQMGGLTNLEALRAATILGAEGLGMQQDLGSIEVGKIADLLVLDKNPLENIEHSLSIRYVMKNGILYDGNTLDTVWPTKQVQRRVPRCEYVRGGC